VVVVGYSRDQTAQDARPQACARRARDAAIIKVSGSQSTSRRRGPD
jgi:hypothetical protein